MSVAKESSFAASTVLFFHKGKRRLSRRTMKCLLPDESNHVKIGTDGSSFRG